MIPMKKLIAMVLFITEVFAKTTLLDDRTVHGDEGLAGVLLLVAGLYFTFLTHRYSNVTPWLCIFMVWFGLIYFFCVKIYPPAPSSIKRRILYIVMSILLGIAVTLVLTCLRRAFHLKNFWYNFSFISLGGLSGLAFSFYLLAMYDNGLIEPTGGRVAFIMFWVVLFAGLMFHKPENLSPICSPVLGAYLFVLGVDCYARTGYTIHLSYFTDTFFDQFYHLNRRSAALQATALVMVGLGMTFQLWQMRLYYRKYFHSNGLA